MDRNDHANEMRYSVIRIESANRYKIDEFDPFQIGTTLDSQWLKNLKRHTFNCGKDNI